MSQPYLGEVKVVSFNFAPRGWALCNGQLLPINQNQALFSLLGTTYGGDGRVNFGLPNLQGRVPIHWGAGFVIGQSAGQYVHTLLQSEMPAHTHTAFANPSTGTQVAPIGNVWAGAASATYAASGNTAMSPQALTTAGGSQPHENTPPYLTLAFIIALQGIFPSQN
jgi:microcystin-dependent protein